MSQDETETLDPPVPTAGCDHRCTDYDEACVDVPDKLACWMFEPARGICPFLSGQIVNA